MHTLANSRKNVNPGKLYRLLGKGSLIFNGRPFQCHFFFASILVSTNTCSAVSRQSQLYFLKDPTIIGFSFIIEGNLQGDYLNTKVRDRAIGKQRETKIRTETEKQLRSLWWSSTSLWLKKPYFIYTLSLMMFAPFCTYDNYGRNSSKKQPKPLSNIVNH